MKPPIKILFIYLVLACSLLSSCSTVKPYYMENSFRNEQIRHNLSKRHKSEFDVNKSFIEVWDRLVQFTSTKYLNPKLDLPNSVIVVDEPIMVEGEFADTRDRNVDAYIFVQPLYKHTEKYKCRSSIKYNIYLKEIEKDKTRVDINIFGNGVQIRKVGTDKWINTKLDATTSGVLEKQIDYYIRKKD